MPHLKRGSSIINTSSVTAYKGSAAMVDYSSTKGAITVRLSFPVLTSHFIYVLDSRPTNFCILGI